MQNRRVLTYLGFALALFLGYLFIRNSVWLGSTQLHTVMEAVATLLALFVGLMAIVRFYTKKTSVFLFIGTAFLGTGMLDGYHALVTSSNFAASYPSSPPSLIPWSWIASRLFLSLFLCLSLLVWKRESKYGDRGRIGERGVYLLAGGLTLASFLFFAFVPLPTGYFGASFLRRPEELVPAFFFLFALIGYLKKGDWRQDAFDHWLVLSLIAGFMGQAMYMSVSEHLFDMVFDMAHLVKKLSYIFVLVGLVINMFHLFRQAEESFETTRRASEALAREVGHRQLAEEEVNASQSRIEAIVETAVDPIITIDEKGTIDFVNRAVEATFGYSAQEVLGQNVKILMPEPYHSEHDGYLENYKNTGERKIIGIGREVVGKRKDGTTFSMELAISEIDIDGRKLFTGIVHDLTEINRTKDELEISNKALQAKNTEL